MNYTKCEKVQTIIDIVKKLKKFPATNNGTIDLYNDQYSFYEDFKIITNKWINTENIELKGFIEFHELNKKFYYFFPKNKNKQPLFVLRK